MNGEHGPMDFYGASVKEANYSWRRDGSILLGLTALSQMLSRRIDHGRRRSSSVPSGGNAGHGRRRRRRRRRRSRHLRGAEKATDNETDALSSADTAFN